LRRREIERATEAIDRLKIKAQSPDVLVTELSGGNAQKVTIAKWLFSDAKVLLLDEPTAGIDIGAKTDVLRLVRDLSAAGMVIVVVSSEFEELLAVADRILVFRDHMLAERVGHVTPGSGRRRPAVLELGRDDHDDHSSGRKISH